MICRLSIAACTCADIESVCNAANKATSADGIVCDKHKEVQSEDAGDPFDMTASTHELLFTV